MSAISKSSPSALNNSLFFQDGELWVRDGSGRLIQISKEGGVLTSSVGSAKGILWGQANLIIAPRTANNYQTAPWTNADDIPPEVLGAGGHSGSNNFTIPQVPPSEAINGVWLVSEIGDDVVDEVFFPWNQYANLDVSAPKDYSFSESALKVSVASGNYVRIRYVLDQDNQNSYLQVLRIDSNPDANGVVKLYPGVVVGQQGRQGEPGPQGPAGPEGGVADGAVTSAKLATSVRDALDGAVQIDSVELDDSNLVMSSDGGTNKTLDLSGVSDPTADSIRDKLEGLVAESRLDASAVKNLPSGGTTDTGETIKTKLEGLTGTDRLEVSAVQDAVSEDQLTQEVGDVEDEVEEIKKEITKNDTIVSRVSASFTNANFIDFPGNPTPEQDAIYRLTIEDFGTQKFSGAELFTKILGSAGGAYNANNSVATPVYGLGPNDGVVAHLGRGAIGNLLIALEDASRGSDGKLRGNGQPEITDLNLTLERGEFIVEPWAERGNATAIPAGKLSNAPQDTAVQIRSKLEGLSGNARLSGTAVKDLPAGDFVGLTDTPASFTGQAGKILQVNSGATALEYTDKPTGGTGAGGTTIRQSSYTPSVPAGTWASELTIALADGTVEADQGITRSGNTLTFTKAGFYVVEGSFYVQSDTPPSQANNVRTFPEFFIKVNGTKDVSSDATFYIRGSGSYLGAGNSNHSYKVTHALKISANDTLTFHAITKNQQADSAFSLTLVGTESELKIVSVEGLKGDAGPAGAQGPIGPAGPQGPKGDQGDAGTGGGGTISNTPRRLTALPADADSLDLDRVVITADYTKANGIDIAPGTFVETSLDGFGVGTRGWWRGLDGYSIGQLHPDDDEIEDLLLVSDTRVVVKRGTLANFTHLVIGTNEYALTYVPQTDYTISSLDGSPQADYYTYTSTAPPAGAWKDVRFRTSPTTLIPAVVI